MRNKKEKSKKGKHTGNSAYNFCFVKSKEEQPVNDSEDDVIIVKEIFLQNLNKASEKEENHSAEAKNDISETEVIYQSSEAKNDIPETEVTNQSLAVNTKASPLIHANPQNFSKRGPFVQHRKKSKSRKKVFTTFHKCSECGKKFANDGNVKRHMSIVHQRERPYTCDTCGKAFSQSYILRNHYKNCTKELSNQDVKRKEGYVSKSSLRVNTNFIKSSPLVPQELKNRNKRCCTKCQKTLSNNNNVHLCERYVCNKCGKSFSQSASVNRHMLSVHLHKRPYKCDECGNAYARKASLQNHHLTHKCSKGFQSKLSLRKHSCNHSKKKLKNEEAVGAKEKKHKCHECEKLFSRRDHLIQHLRVHTGERPFRCEICQKAFTLKWNLKVHSRIHTGEQPNK